MSRCTHAEEKLRQIAGVLFEGERRSCSSVAVSPDGNTVFASAAAGILRWSAEDAEPQATLALAGINGLIRGVSEDWVLLQARGKLDAFGELRLYRLSDGSLVRTEEPSSTRSPFSGAIVTRCYTAAADPCRESVLADLDGNGLVDDYPIVVANYGKGCAA